MSRREGRVYTTSLLSNRTDDPLGANLNIGAPGGRNQRNRGGGECERLLEWTLDWTDVRLCVARRSPVQGSVEIVQSDTILTLPQAGGWLA